MHFVAGVDHKSGFALLVHKTCETFKLCVSRDHFYIILHSESLNAISSSSAAILISAKSTKRSLLNVSKVHNVEKSSSIFQTSSDFLKALGIKNVSLWEGEFSSEKKMMR